MAEMTRAPDQPIAARRFHYRDSVYFQDGHWLTAILTAILYLILATALDAAGHVSSLVVVIPVTAGAFALGLLMSFSRFDGFFALSHSMFVGLAWILYSMAQTVSAREIEPFLSSANISELQARVYFVLLRLLDWVDAAISRSASADNYVFIFEICFLMWWLTYLGVWSIFRYGYTWRAVAPAGVVLLINTYYAPRPTLGFLVAFVLIGLVLLVRTNLSEQQLRWREQRIYFQPDIVWDFLRNGLLFSALLVLAAWVLPGLGRNPQVRALLEPINSTWESTAENVQRLYQGLNRQAPEAASSFGNSLSLGGERNVTDTPVFQVQASRARYWRAVVFDTYSNDGRWLNTAEETQRFGTGEIAPIASWRARSAISQTITLLAPVGTMLFGMPEVAQSTVQLDAQVRVQAGAAAIPVAEAPAGTPPIEFTMIRTNRELNPGDRYILVSAATDATVRDLQASSQTYPVEIADLFLQVPEGFSSAVAQLAQEITTGLTTPYDKAKAIESYLRTITYNDAISAPPAGRDPLEYFLFDIQEGYCDYYATAMAMMLRVVGVPARTASGYAEGFFDEEAGVYFVTERDAHTWVEVFFPEFGWIEFEPTAGESPLERPPGEDPADITASEMAPTPTPAPNDSGAAPTPPPAQQEMPPQFTGEELLGAQEQSPESPVSAWWLVLLALVVVVPIGVFLIWRVRSNGPTVFTAELPLQIYERMERWSQRIGLPIRLSQTPHEHASRLSSALPDAEPLVREVTDSYVRYRFGGPGQTIELNAQPETPALWQTWKQLESIFWRAWRQTWGRRLLRERPDPHTLVRNNDKEL